MTWQISADDVDALLSGGLLYGAGGAGTGGTMAAVLRRVLGEQGPVDVLELSELSPDGHVVPVGIVGSPTLSEEKPPAGDELIHAVQAVAECTGVQVSAVACVGAVGDALLAAVTIAAQLGVPLVDADAMGRGFPSLEQTAFTLAGTPIVPFAMTDSNGGCLILDDMKACGVERAVRSALGTRGGWACCAMRPQPVPVLHEVMTAGTVRAALRVGRLCRAGDHAGLVADHGARALFEGKVVEVRRRSVVTSGGSAGMAVIEHAAEPGRTLRLEMQSEYRLAVEDGRPLACVPDLVCVLEHRSGEFVGPEQLRYGLWVRVLGLPSPARWRTPAGLTLAGPRAFGYDLDYVPLDEAFGESAALPG